MKRKGTEYKLASECIAGGTKNAIDEYASRVARSLDFGPGNNIETLIERFGGSVRYDDPSDIAMSNNGGTIWVHGKNDFEIVLPNTTSPRRDRFTLAHEFGHYLLHSKQGQQPLVANRTGSDRAEWEANWFAAGFLMPKSELEKAIKSTNSPILLADLFQVSTKAMQIRLSSIGLKK